MQKNIILLILTITYFTLQSLQTSISFESFLQSICSSTITHNISSNNEYFAQNVNFTICSNITIRPDIPKTQLILKLSTVFLDIEKDSTLTLIGFSITFVYLSPTNGAALFNIRNASIYLQV